MKRNTRDFRAPKWKKEEKEEQNHTPRKEDAKGSSMKEKNYCKNTKGGTNSRTL